MTEEKREVTAQDLDDIALDSDLTLDVNWEAFDVPKEEIFTKMAENVIDQIGQVPPEHQIIVCMATMTKMLVENFVLNVHINDLTTQLSNKE